MAETDGTTLRRHLEALLERWQRQGLPGRQGLTAAAGEVERRRRDTGLAPLWQRPPLMLTATLDDGFGFGLEVIEAWARALGLEVQPLGLLQTPEAILEACWELRPALLGLTVLQLDSAEALVEVGRGRPEETAVVVGGPIFASCPELAEQANLRLVARSAADFVRFLIDDFSP